MIYNRNMTQKAIYWSPPANDGSGDDWSAVVPVVINCRWQDDVSVQRDAEGQEFVSAHVVYCDADVQGQGWLVLGSVAPAAGTDPYDVADARKIMRVYRTNSLDGSLQLIMAVL